VLELAPSTLKCALVISLLNSFCYIVLHVLHVSFSWFCGGVRKRTGCLGAKLLTQSATCLNLVPAAGLTVRARCRKMWSAKSWWSSWRRPGKTTSKQDGANSSLHSKHDGLLGGGQGILQIRTEHASSLHLFHLKKKSWQPTFGDNWSHVRLARTVYMIYASFATVYLINSLQ